MEKHKTQLEWPLTQEAHKGSVASSLLAKSHTFYPGLGYTKKVQMGNIRPIEMERNRPDQTQVISQQVFIPTRLIFVLRSSRIKVDLL